MNEIPENCAVCLQSCIHPVLLDCKHVFCFLCVKGAATLTKKCPMCRRPIRLEFLENPRLLQSETNAPEITESKKSNCDQSKEESKGKTSKNEENEKEDKFSWFYAGHNGWWQYDERTSQELEMAHEKKSKQCELLIAGYIYTIDLENMVQHRKSEPGRKRKIKRDLVKSEKKGIAGLRVLASHPQVPMEDLSNLMGDLNISTTNENENENENENQVVQDEA